MIPSLASRPRRLPQAAWTIWSGLVPLLVPSGSTITLFANPTTVTLNGTSEVTAAVYENGGIAVQNGTLD